MEADQPIISSSQDRFGRKHFADRIAEVIANRESTSGLVVGIHAPWGDGKTSVLNMIIERLGTFENVVVVRFNPWRFPEESLLLRSFFLDVARKIDSALVTRKETLVALAEEYGDVLSAIPYAGKMSGAVKVFARKRSHVDIDALKTRFENALATSSKRIVVMMDDIDRLDKAEIHTVFRLVKLLGDFPNTTYVLFFDEKRVAEALGEKYVGVDGGKSFLEKIIQVPLSLPPASRHARRALAIEGIDAALRLANYKLTEDEAQRLGEIFDKGFMSRMTTPRVAKRFGNALTFALPILIGETDVVDLILIEGTRIFYPELYAAIRGNADAFSPGATDPTSWIRNTRFYSEEVSRAANTETERIPEVQKIGQEPPESLRITLSPKFNNTAGERDEYEMNFLIENTRDETVADYRVEVEFPSAFLARNWHPHWEIPERETNTHRFFRMAQGFYEGSAARWTLYGKDKRNLFTINFHVDKTNYRAESLQQLISAKVYLEENLVEHVEKPMRDIVRDR